MDIIKPPPIRKLEKIVPGGAGVVVDDLLAGVYAGVILSGVVFFFRDGFLIWICISPDAFITLHLKKERQKRMEGLNEINPGL